MIALGKLASTATIGEGDHDGVGNSARDEKATGAAATTEGETTACLNPGYIVHTA